MPSFEERLRSTIEKAKEKDAFYQKAFSEHLNDTLETLASDYAEAVATGRGKVFSIDGPEDAKELKKVIKSLVRVHNWYTPNSEHLEISDYV